MVSQFYQWCRFRVRGMRWLGAQYVKKPVKAVVIVTWLGILAAGIYGTSQMRVDADVNNFIPEGSYLRDWIDTIRQDFAQTGTSVGLYWVNDPEVRVSTVTASAFFVDSPGLDGYELALSHVYSRLLRIPAKRLWTSIFSV